MNESPGGVQAFIGKTNFSAAQIDSAFTGAIADKDTATTPLSWLQLRKKAGVTLKRNGAMLELENDVDGMTDVVISESDKWELSMDITQMDKDMFFNLTGLDPTKGLEFPASGNGVGGKLSYVGTSMLANGFPVLLLRSKYDGGNTTDVPKLGTGADPLGWCFFKMVLADRNMELKYDPKGQLVLPLALKPVAVDGTTNKGVAFWHGAMTKLA